MWPKALTGAPPIGSKSLPKKGLDMDSRPPQQTQRIWDTFAAKKPSKGRRPIFDSPEPFLEQVLAYLAWVKDNPRYIIKVFANGAQISVPHTRYPSARGCALFMGIAPRTWRSWKQRDDEDPLKKAVLWAEEVFTQEKMEGVVTGEFSAAIVARDLGLRDKEDEEAALSVQVIDHFEG